MIFRSTVALLAQRPVAFRALVVASALALPAQTACSGSEDDDGVVGTGGAFEGSGGAEVAGGSPGSGGAEAGGSFGAGGLVSVGGSSSGGSQSAGGTDSGGSAAGGVAQGAGGSDGSGGKDGVGGGDGAGGSTENGFQPCPTDGPCKILPLGDSITFGMGSESYGGGGYRVELFRMALEANKDITFTGTQNGESPNGPDMVEGVPFPKGHEGISGQTNQAIASRIPSPALSEIPHIVLVHAGTNDMWNGPAGAPDRLGDILDKLIAGAPDALIVVSNIVPWPSNAGLVDTYNADIVPVIQARIDEGAHVVFVDQFTPFPGNGLSSDGIHPNQTGYIAMAEVWYGAIESYLP